MLCVLGLIAWELQRVHADITTPLADESSTMVEAPDESIRSVDAIRDDIAELAQKIDAILVVMARSK